MRNSKGINSNVRVATLSCPFCSGPHGAYGTKAHCPVCGDAKVVTIPEPVRHCVFCHGTGKVDSTGVLFLCLVCGGKGALTVPDPNIPCPTCEGRGFVPGSAQWPCLDCKGMGVIAGTDQT